MEERLKHFQLDWISENVSEVQGLTLKFVG